MTTILAYTATVYPSTTPHDAYCKSSSHEHSASTILHGLQATGLWSRGTGTQASGYPITNLRGRFDDLVLVTYIIWMTHVPSWANIYNSLQPRNIPVKQGQPSWGFLQWWKSGDGVILSHLIHLRLGLAGNENLNTTVVQLYEEASQKYLQALRALVNGDAHPDEPLNHHCDAKTKFLPDGMDTVTFGGVISPQLKLTPVPKKTKWFSNMTIILLKWLRFTPKPQILVGPKACHADLEQDEVQDEQNVMAQQLIAALNQHAQSSAALPSDLLIQPRHGVCARRARGVMQVLNSPDEDKEGNAEPEEMEDVDVQPQSININLSKAREVPIHDGGEHTQDLQLEDSEPSNSEFEVESNHSSDEDEENLSVTSEPDELVGVSKWHHTRRKAAPKRQPDWAFHKGKGKQKAVRSKSVVSTSGDKQPVQPVKPLSPVPTTPVENEEEAEKGEEVPPAGEMEVKNVVPSNEEEYAITAEQALNLSIHSEDIPANMPNPLQPGWHLQDSGSRWAAMQAHQQNVSTIEF
ncbi:hypothetical protein C8Q73DRAFT_669259 [Cubamyces lactineus]|nr:hypothetical protein C8Q73DRAFT_669259 [Cubamyces lactineus]